MTKFHQYDASMSVLVYDSNKSYKDERKNCPVPKQKAQFSRV